MISPAFLAARIAVLSGPFMAREDTGNAWPSKRNQQYLSKKSDDMLLLCVKYAHENQQGAKFPELAMGAIEISVIGGAQ